MDYNFNAPNQEKEVTLEELSPGDFFIFKQDYVDECYTVCLVCDFGRGIDIVDNVYNCLVLDLEDNLVSFEKGYLPVVRVEPFELMTFKKVK